MTDIRVLLTIVAVITLFGMVPLLGRLLPNDLPEDDEGETQQ